MQTEVLQEPAKPVASAKRVLGVVVSALLLPWLAILLVGSMSDEFAVHAWRTEDSAALTAALALWIVGGPAFAYASRLKSMLPGLLISAPFVVGFLVLFGSPLVGLLVVSFSVVVGLAGLVREGTPDISRGFRITIVAVLIFASAPPALAAHVSLEEAAVAAAGRGTQFIASLESGDEAWGLTTSTTSVGGGDEEPVEKVRFELPSTTLLLIRLRRSALGSWHGRDVPSRILPFSCATPSVTGWPIIEVMHNCWLPEEKLLVEVAPMTARSVTLDGIDTSITRKLASRKGGWSGMIHTTDHPPQDGPIRFAYRDKDGVLIDAVPSMSIAQQWYSQIASAAGAELCGLNNGVLSCSYRSMADGDPVRRARVSIALLRPEEFRAACKTTPPPGAWVAVAQMWLGHDTDGRSWDRGRLASPQTNLHQVVLGVNPQKDRPPAQWLNTSVVQRARGSLCFPPFPKRFLSN